MAEGRAGEALVRQLTPTSAGTKMASSTATRRARAASSRSAGRLEGRCLEYVLKREADFSGRRVPEGRPKPLLE